MKKVIMVVIFVVILAVIFTVIPASLFAAPDFIVPPGQGHPAVPAVSVGVANENAADGLHNACYNTESGPGNAWHVLLNRVSPHG